MLFKCVLAFIMAKIERMNYDGRPPYYPSEGSVEERKARLVNQRMDDYQTALMKYHRNQSRKVDRYLETLYKLVESAMLIETYEDWEREVMKDRPDAPDSKKGFIFSRKAKKSTI